MKKGSLVDTLCVIIDENAYDSRLCRHCFPIGLIIRPMFYDVFDDTYNIVDAKNQRQATWIEADKILPIVLDIGDDDDEERL